jgi:hypothetical protein
MSDWASADAARFAAGSRVAGFWLEEQIGQGPTGTVFRARDERTGGMVALKLLAPELAADREFSGTLIREAQAATAVGEPHILPVLRTGQDGQAVFVAMPHVAGKDAGALLRQEGPLPRERVAPIIWRVASALDAAHRAGLQHGDVKPGNILVDTPPGQPDLVYLSDFGQHRTPVAGLADQQALACLAFELLTGVPPFRRDEATGMMPTQPTETPARPTSLRADLPRAVDDALGRALILAPGYGYPTCRELADALQGALWPTPSPVLQGAPAATASAATASAAPSGAAPAGAATSGAAPAGAGPSGVAPAGAAWSGAGYSGPTLVGGGYPETPPTAGPAPQGGVPGREPWLVQRQRRNVRLLPVALTGVAVLIVAAIVAGALLVLHRSPPKPPTLSPISLSSANPVTTGDVWVEYRGGRLATAQLAGTLKGVASGEVARLYAQQFPFGSGFAPVSPRIALHPSGSAATASYSFQVTPTLATIYRVEVFASATAPTPLTRSKTTTVYVSYSAATPTPPACAHPTCRQQLTIDVFVPPSAISTEIAKPWYVYFRAALSSSAATTPAAPQNLGLNEGDAKVTPPKQLGPDEFSLQITFTFASGKGGVNWIWDACTQDTESVDGMGLPGSHGCGARNIPANVTYLG